eukprot:gene10189-11078_t
MIAFNLVIVLVSFGISFLGAYTAICGCEQLRISFMIDQDRSFSHVVKWYFLIGASLGGVGIWAMHFIGMGALTLSYSEPHDVDNIGYNLVISLLSLLSAVVAVVTGVAVASKDRMFAKTKSEILDMIVDDLHIMSLEEIRSLSPLQYLWICSTTDLKWLVMGGVIAASGVCVMHYIGMESMEFHGRIEWDVGIVAASVVIAVIASIAAFWILFRLLSMYPCFESFRLISAVIMAIAVCGMHYCGMVAAEFHVAADIPIDHKVTSSVMEKSSSLYLVLFSAVAVSWIFNVMIVSDLRQRYHNNQQKLLKTPFNLSLSSPRHRTMAKSEEAKSKTSDIHILKWNSVIPESP